MANGQISQHLKLQHVRSVVSLPLVGALFVHLISLLGTVELWGVGGADEVRSIDKGHGARYGMFLFVGADCPEGAFVSLSEAQLHTTGCVQQGAQGHLF